MEERKFWDLENVTYCHATLTVRIAEMRQGEPDGCVGLPLLVTDESERITLHFDNVTEFRSCAEPCYRYEKDVTRLTAYLDERTGSQFLQTTCPYGGGAKDPARHFCVLTERIVIEVLANALPRIESSVRVTNPERCPS